MLRITGIHLLTLFTCTLNVQLNAQNVDYSKYHQQILEIERLVSIDQFEKALEQYDRLFEQYDFVFLREYKIAAQLATHLGDEYRAFDYLGQGVSHGWTLDQIRKCRKLRKLKKNPRWTDLESSYQALRQDYQDRINDSVRNVMEEMFHEDQKMARKHLFRPSQNSKHRYIVNHAIPISEKHMHLLLQLIEDHGYPGERIIGNSTWTSTILGHHNSLDPEYQQKDQLFPDIRPKLLDAIDRGEMNPYDFAIIEDWYISVKSERKRSSYGIIKELEAKDIDQSNEMRNELNLRTIDLRNRLIDIEAKTGIDLNLSYGSWLKGKIKSSN